MTHIENMLDFLKRYKDRKEDEGFIPTVELLIEELEEADKVVGEAQLAVMNF